MGTCSSLLAGSGLVFYQIGTETQQVCAVLNVGWGCTCVLRRLLCSLMLIRSKEACFNPGCVLHVPCHRLRRLLMMLRVSKKAPAAVLAVAGVLWLPMVAQRTVAKAVAHPRNVILAVALQALLA